MNCRECQELLQRRLDGERLPALETLEQHLTQCAACRSQHAAALRLLDGLPRLPKAQLAPNFAQAMTADVLFDRRNRQQKMRRRVAMTMSLAASVMLMLVAAYYWVPREQPIPREPLAKEPSKKDPTPAIEKKKAPRHALTGLTERWADATRDHAKVVLVAANLDGVDQLPAVNDLPVLDPGLREAGQEMTDGVRAVTRNARKAFDFFARELPMPEMGELKN